MNTFESQYVTPPATSLSRFFDFLLSSAEGQQRSNSYESYDSTSVVESNITNVTTTTNTTPNINNIISTTTTITTSDNSNNINHHQLSHFNNTSTSFTAPFDTQQQQHQQYKPTHYLTTKTEATIRKSASLSGNSNNTSNMANALTLTSLAAAKCFEDTNALTTNVAAAAPFLDINPNTSFFNHPDFSSFQRFNSFGDPVYNSFTTESESGYSLGSSGNSNKLHYLYKTEVCRSWEESGVCRYGSKCQFAHGPNELREVNRHPKYKTEICCTFATTGTCPYAKRCRFIHQDGPVTSVGKKLNESKISLCNGNTSTGNQLKPNNSECKKVISPITRRLPIFVELSMCKEESDKENV